MTPRSLGWFAALPLACAAASPPPAQSKEHAIVEVTPAAPPPVLQSGIVDLSALPALPKLRSLRLAGDLRGISGIETRRWKRSRSCFINRAS